MKTACVRMPGRLSDRHQVKVRLRKAGLHTVCEEAKCPNIAECFKADTATFLILGKVCTRNCSFCAITKNRHPAPDDPDEPRRLAEAVRDLGITHAVITSVTRDDLPDGGAAAFAACIRSINQVCPQVRVEVLVPDFLGSQKSLDQVLQAGPQVFNHNIETIERLYPVVRPGAAYARSLGLLAAAARRAGPLVKSGLMVGLGESYEEVIQVLADLKRAGCQVVTIGQYLRPTKNNCEVIRQVSQEEFNCFIKAGDELGLTVIAGPLVRSSYQAGRVYSQLMQDLDMLE
ncbi:MAG: lipoyl synthase [Deltaproteobacteria bacterium]|nr:lipoyl synthase [Deltaproteobacteria bacterium]MBW1872033.1 lipoyl synthase [Deltaproteobacteria bacterium]